MNFYNGILHASGQNDLLCFYLCHGFEYFVDICLISLMTHTVHIFFVPWSTKKSIIIYKQFFVFIENMYLPH